MSEVRRYDFCYDMFDSSDCSDTYGMCACDDGDYVTWEDYKSLQSEVETLNFLNANQSREIRNLQAEVEALRNPWISVEDRLPELKPGEECLWYQPELVRVRRDLSLRPRCVLSSCLPRRLTTHWMPLPSPDTGGK